MVLLFVQPACREVLLVRCTDQDTSFAVFRLRAAVEADAGTSGHLAEDRQEPLKLGRLCHLHVVDECRNEVVGVFEGVADRCQVLLVNAGTAAESVGCLVYSASYFLRSDVRIT